MGGLAVASGDRGAVDAAAVLELLIGVAGDALGRLGAGRVRQRLAVRVARDARLLPVDRIAVDLVVFDVELRPDRGLVGQFRAGRVVGVQGHHRPAIRRREPGDVRLAVAVEAAPVLKLRVVLPRRRRHADRRSQRGDERKRDAVSRAKMQRPTGHGN
jgi:hypothetical protein